MKDELKLRGAFQFLMAAGSHLLASPDYSGRAEAIDILSKATLACTYGIHGKDEASEFITNWYVWRARRTAPDWCKAVPCPKI